MRFLLLLALGAVAGLFAGCSIPIPTKNDPASSYVCQNSPNSFASCCTGRGGALACSPPTGGHYFRSSDGALICGDGSVSPVCYR